jgi:hypothetical protein
VIGTPFVVDQTPFICWDWELKEKNLDFLRGIDATYFQYVVESNIDHLDGEHKHRAALSIRLAYSQALETLFALLGSLVQAPTCPLGWMLAYRTELPSVVSKIAQNKTILNRGRLQQVSWESLSAAVYSHVPHDELKKEWIQSGFANCWSQFATDFLDPHLLAEYNSMKHGLRVSLGGFSLAVGIEEMPGIPAPADAMQSVCSSIFGASFFERERIGTAAAFNFRPRRKSSNWSPENILNAVVIAAMSINNVISYLRILNGDEPHKCEFKNPPTPQDFRVPWAERVPVPQMSMDTLITQDDIPLKTKDDVLASYPKRDE